jgi:transcriptional regulator with XRE-family HTH domain
VDIKNRRKALGWSRQELAERSAVPKSVVALIERDEWSDAEALERVATVLGLAEAGNTDPRLPPPVLTPRRTVGEA